MRKIYNIIPITLVSVMFLGLFIGPVSWYFANSIRSDYDEFVSTSTKTTGVVYKKMKEVFLRNTQCFVAVRYKTPDKLINLATKVKLEPLMQSNLEINETVNLYYKDVDGKREIVFEGEADSKNLGIIYQSGFGVILTIYSYLALLTLIICAKMKIRILANPFLNKKP